MIKFTRLISRPSSQNYASAWLALVFLLSWASREDWYSGRCWHPYRSSVRRPRSVTHQRSDCLSCGSWSSFLQNFPLISCRRNCFWAAAAQIFCSILVRYVFGVGLLVREVLVGWVRNWWEVELVQVLIRGCGRCSVCSPLSSLSPLTWPTSQLSRPESIGFVSAPISLPQPTASRSFVYSATTFQPLQQAFPLLHQELKLRTMFTANWSPPSAHVFLVQSQLQACWSMVRSFWIVSQAHCLWGWSDVGAFMGGWWGSVRLVCVGRCGRVTLFGRGVGTWWFFRWSFWWCRGGCVWVFYI